MSEILHIESPITAHCFNSTRDLLAVCPNTNEVHIYSKADGFKKVVHVLKEHDKVITGIDFNPASSSLVTCSQDRNAYVWDYNPETDTWQPTLVLLRLTRSATTVKWSPNGTKFAVASGARMIAVCQFDQEQNWWTAKHLKKPIRSTVLSLDWHPNGVLLAAGSADMKARVFSAYLKEVDQKPEPTVWGSKLPFNTVCGEYSSPSGGWVHAVAFSPSGDALAFAGHDSSVSIVYPSGPEQAPQAVHNVRLPNLPFLSLIFSSENSIIGAGHDYDPIQLTGDLNSGWVVNKSLDDPSSRAHAPSASAARAGGPGRLASSAAFQTFRQADSRGISSAGSGGVAVGTSNVKGGERNTAHQNTITSIRAYEGQFSAEVTKISTSGLDGRIVVWKSDGASLTSGVAKMSI